MRAPHLSATPGLLRWLVLSVLAVGVRLLYTFSTSPDAPIASTDAWGYRQLAANLDSGNGFSLRGEAPFVPDSIRTPLYPAFLLLVRRTLGSSPRTAAGVQAFLDAGTMLLTGWLATRLAGHRAGRIAALLYALNPTQVRYASELLTETLLSFLLALAVYLLICYRGTMHLTAPLGSPLPSRPERATGYVVLLGAVTGFSALCKPNVEFMAFVWLLAIVWMGWGNWRRVALDSTMLILAALVILLPWALRNRLVFGRWFLSTAFEGNVSRVSAPATLAALQRRYVAPWTPDWEALFGQIVASASTRYDWHAPWDTLTVREMDLANYQVYATARQVLLEHPLAWLLSHAQGMARYLEPQTYRVCYARFTGRPWPPDVLDDAAILVLRALGSGDWSVAGQIIVQERWLKLSRLQGVVWWGTFAGQLVGLALMLRGAHRLRSQRVLVMALLLAIAYVLWVPGPIAYERFRVPVMSLILALIAASLPVAIQAKGTVGMRRAHTGPNGPGIGTSAS